MVLLEAMYHRKATIISAVPGSGMGWVVDDGITGTKVPIKSVMALTNALRHLQLNRDKISLLGEHGRRKFDQQFHIDQSAAGVAELYEKIDSELAVQAK